MRLVYPLPILSSAYEPRSHATICVSRWGGRIIWVLLHCKPHTCFRTLIALAYLLYRQAVCDIYAFAVSTAHPILSMRAKIPRYSLPYNALNRSCSLISKMPELKARQLPLICFTLYNVTICVTRWGGHKTWVFPRHPRHSYKKRFHTFCVGIRTVEKGGTQFSSAWYVYCPHCPQLMSLVCLLFAWWGTCLISEMPDLQAEQLPINLFHPL